MTGKITLLTFFLAACAAAATLDGQSVYTANCTRCHITMKAMPQKMTRSILRHMRVRAILSQAEADAVFEYLTQSGRPATVKRAMAK